MEKPKLHVTLTEKVDWIHQISPFSCPKKSTTKTKKIFQAVTQNRILLSFISQTLTEILKKSENDFAAVETNTEFEKIYEMISTIQKRIFCDPHSLVIALIYFKRYIEEKNIKKNFLKNENQLKNYFSVCVMLSMKMNEDRFYKNKIFFKDLKLIK